MSKTRTKGRAQSTRVAEQVAEFIGRTMGALLNRKDALGKQMAEVDRQIAEVRQRVVRQFGDYLPGRNRTRGRKNASGIAGRISARMVSAETRRKMAEAARKRWARERAKKAKASKTK